MPSLADRIAANKKVLVRGPGGLLQEETQESVQDLSQQAGLAAPPLTPVGTAAIGGTPKQQDMAGSAAQKQAALNIAATASPDTNLQQAQRRQPVRTQATDQEQQKIEKSQNLQNLGSLGDRVHDFISGQMNKLTSQQAQVQVAGTVSGRAGALTSQQAAAVKPLLEQLASDPNNMQLQLQVNQALGYDVSRQLSPTEINQLYANATESIAQSGAQAVQDTLTANDLIAQGGLGYDQSQLAQLLGVPPESVGSMTVQQIQDQVTKLMSDEFSSTQQLEQQAQSGQLGVAERGLARQAAREASAVGTRSSEADVASLEQQIQNAEQVSFGGRVMSIEEMLSDDNISRTISDYLNAAPDSPQRKQLEQAEPQLVEFIRRNEAVLDDAAKALSQGASQFQTLQTENKRRATLDGLLSDELASAIVPGFNELSAESIDPSKIPVLAVAQSMTGPQKQMYTQNLAQITQQFPGAAEELRGLNANDIAQLDLANPNGRWNEYVNQQRRYQEIMNIPDNDINALMSAVYGTDANWEADLQQNAAMSVLGLAKPNKTLKLVDSDRDGKPDSPQAIKARMVYGQPSLRDAISGTSKVKDTKDYAPNAQLQEYDKATMLGAVADGDKEAIQSALYSRLGDRASDGVIDAKDIAKSFSKPGKNYSERLGTLQELLYLDSKAKLDPETKATLSQVIDTQRTAATDSYLSRKDTGFTISDQVEKLFNEEYEPGGMPGTKLKFIDTPQAMLNKFPALLDQIVAAKETLKTQKKEELLNSDQIDSRIEELNSVVQRMHKQMFKQVKKQEKQMAGKATVDRNLFMSIFDKALED